MSRARMPPRLSRTRSTQTNANGAGKALVPEADVGAVADHKRLVDEALCVFGRIDSPVLNAGYMDNRVPMDVNEQDCNGLRASGALLSYRFSPSRVTLIVVAVPEGCNLTLAA